MRDWLRSFLPHQPVAGPAERARAVAGACFGIATAMLLTGLAGGGNPGLPILAAPMGASAVLLFAVPSSPLAQPWPMFGGNVTSAIVGVICASLIDDPFMAAPAAVALAVLAMTMLRCVHPPGGAVALTAVVGGPDVLGAGLQFVLAPIALNSALLLGAALLFNNLARRPWPHAAPAPVDHRTADPPPQDRVGYTAEDLDSALKEFGHLLTIDRDDLDSLFREVEVQAHRRLHGEISCAAIMSRDVITVSAGNSATMARALLRVHALGVLPVVDDDGRVVGRVGHAELADTQGGVAEVMTRRIETATEDTPISRLLVVLSRGRSHEVMITGPDGRLSGIVTQTDLLAGLYRSYIVEAVAARPRAA
ncbi:MAG: HPP family protein [Sphingomonadales bacterium]